MAGIQKVTDQHIADTVVNIPPIASQFDDAANDSDKSFTVPNNELWKLNWAHVVYVSDVTVGNRQFIFAVSDPDGNVLIDIHAGTVQAASLTRHYSLIQGVYRETSFIDGSLQTPIPADLYLGAGYVIRFYDSAAISAEGDDMTVAFQYQKFTV